MPQVFQPFGLSFFDYEGGKTSMPIRQFALSSSSVGTGESFGVGDAMSFYSNPSSTQSGLVQSEIPTFPNNTSPGGYTVGIFNGLEYTTQQNQNVPGSGIPGDFWAANSPIAANTIVEVKLLHLPNTLFAVQCNGPLPSSGAYGFNFNLTGNGGAATTAVPAPTDTQVGANPSTRTSQQFLMVTGGAGTATGSAGFASFSGQCKIIDLATDSTLFPNNNWTDPFPIVLVRFNLHVFSAPTPSFG